MKALSLLVLLFTMDLVRSEDPEDFTVDREFYPLEINDMNFRHTFID